MKLRAIVLCIIIEGICPILQPSYSQTSPPTGILQGIVADAETKSPLIGATIMIKNSVLGTVSDTLGKFTIEKIPVGSYSLIARFIGYETSVTTDIIIRPQRVSSAEIGLRLLPLESKEVLVTAGYFSASEEQPTGITNFSREEIRRAPGAAGDISRIIVGLPSVAKVSDQSNALIVRGGSPVENAFFLDNIEIPNINHFPTQGASGGSISMVNIDLIQEVNFFAGGFSSAYGDKLSSIMELTYREGNRTEFNGQLNLDFIGFGGIAEGPLAGGRGSYMVSARRSYLDMIVQTFNVGTTVAPSYGEYQGKVVYDLNPDHKISFLGLWGDDHNNPDRSAGVDNDMIYYGNQDHYERTTGATWRALWSKDAYSSTSLSHSSSRFTEDMLETSSGMLIMKNRSLEQTFTLRNTNHLRINQLHTVEFGIEAKYFTDDYDTHYSGYTNALGVATPASSISSSPSAQSVGVYGTYSVKPFLRTTATVGLRADYFSYTERTVLSPRVSISYQVNELTTLKGSTGIYDQHLPLLMLSQQKSFSSLNDLRAVHYVVGADYLITENTKLSIELYEKEYVHFPVDPAQPSLFVIDELFYRYGFFFNHAALNDNGTAYSRGIELIVQKKLAEDFYGLASATYYTSKYTGGDNVVRERVCDNRFIVSIEGGYKPNNEWEFSARWFYAGGSPYTPLNIAESRRLRRDVFDETRINGARYPDVHSLNVRFDKRFHFTRSNLVFYFSVWNVYGNKNVTSYFWSDKKDGIGAMYQWIMLPVFGLQYEM